jgi:LacI family transcriptional regulator
MVSLRYVAKLAGVSLGTASQALNDSPKVKKETLKKVREVAQRLNYIPNIHAKRLHLKRAESIVIVCAPNISDISISEIYTKVFIAIHEAMKKVGYDIIQSYLKEIDVKNFNLPKIVTQRGVDGIIFLGDICDNRYLFTLQQQNIPLIIIGSYIKNSGMLCITVDNSKGAFEAVKYLLKMGHKNIGFISGTLRYSFNEERLEGYRSALNEYNIKFSKNLIQEREGLSVEDGYKAMKKLLKGPLIPTVVFAACDTMAIGAIRAIRDGGLSVPKDISVVGFDDIEIAKYYIPPLTTVKIDKERLGRIAAEKLYQMIRGDITANKEGINIPTKLIIRDSCGIPNR